ncbi:pentatricopeptide repeat domain-containing protein 3, mitochondrial isoform X2 [Rhinatrema bivittatum]|uniref:pentatricopeptide repeat domain-containing protein 3, mitochondrial isoform X2 n=1 Tax=Rhinatrema bivittatum TaxID=194408 RepID=UPI001128CCED|nr:pentatricopeptide repeat domain-containing protein 3, mitochondrial isoform X2 [Rhinatrema bivittatum]
MPAFWSNKPEIFWDKTAVLQALASTVKRDPTASHYMFQDDPYLIPKTTAEFRLFSLSKESGCNAARYIFNTYPKFFETDYAEPHIPCLMPETLEPQTEGVNEAALKELIQLRRVQASVDMFDRLLQAGTTVTLETSNYLLDLLCFYGDREPPRDDQLEEPEQEVVEHQKRRMGQLRRASDFVGVWRQNNNAERIFNLMTERNAPSFCAMIRGMVKYGAYAKAFNMYTELQNNRLTADVHTFNALISATPEVKEKYNEKWALITDLLEHMVEQKVQPNLLTFNAILKSLRRCGALGKTYALQTLCEMKALNIEPSFATFDHLLGIFYKAASSARGQTEILSEVLDEIEGKHFVLQDPNDVHFFADAMRVCLDLKDVELAYRLHRILETGDNWKFAGNPYQQSTYYGRFFNLLCMMEQIDVVLKWYRELVPSLYFPNSQGMRDLLQSLDMDNRLDLVPQIWKDIKQIGHSNKPDLVEEVLMLMARDLQTPELQGSFADCALDIKSVYETREKRRVPLEWTSSALGNIAILVSRAGRTEEAWKMLELFKKSNRVPSNQVMNEFLDSAKQSNNKAHAVHLVKMAAGFALPATAKLARRVMTEFELSEEQKKTLVDLDVQSSDSSDSDDDSDQEQK